MTSTPIVDASLKRRKRVACGATSNILNRVSIHDGPDYADGSTFGDFAMDAIISAGSKAVILTLVERYSGIIFTREMEYGKSATHIAKAVVQILAPFKGKIRLITTDNGSEFAEHQYISKMLGISVYFADPTPPGRRAQRVLKQTNKTIRKKENGLQRFRQQKTKRIQRQD